MAGRGIQLPCPMDMGYGGISSDDDSSPKELFGAGIPSAKELFMDIHDMPYSSRLGVTTTHHACGAPATSREHEHHHDHHAQSPAATGDVLSSQEEPARKRLHSDATRCDVDWRQGEHTASMSQGYEQLAGQNMMEHFNADGGPTNVDGGKGSSDCDDNVTGRPGAGAETDENDAKQKRRQQNRQAAARHRERARQCREEVDQLRREIADLKKEKAELIAKLQFNSSVCIDSTMEWVLQTFWLRRKLHFSSVSKIVTNVTSLFEMVRARRQNPNLQELTTSNMYNVRDELRKDKQNVPRDWKLLWRSGT